MRMTVLDPFKMSRRIADWDDDWSVFDLDNTEMDVYDEGDNIVVEVKAPGFDEKNVEISIEGNTFTVTGKMEKSEVDEDKAKKYYRKEMSSASFTRSTSLPSKVVADKSTAKFKNGILKVTMPKAEEDKPKKVMIQPE